MPGVGCVFVVAGGIVALGTHVAVQQLKPGPCKCLAECHGVFDKALADGAVDGVVLERHVGGGHHRHDFFAATVDFWCFVSFGDINRMPYVCASRAFGQLPLVVVQQLEIPHVPLGWVGGPWAFDAAGDSIDTDAALVGACPAKALSLDGGTLRLGTDGSGGTVAVGLTEGVSAGDEGECLFVVHGHAFEGLAHVLGRQEGVGVAVWTLGIDINQTHLDCCKGVFEVLA